MAANEKRQHILALVSSLLCAYLGCVIVQLVEEQAANNGAGDF